MSVQSFGTIPAETSPVSFLPLGINSRSYARQVATGDLALDAAPTVRIDLPHMDVVLSISAEPAGRAADDAGLAISAAREGMSGDPVIGRLLHELGDTKGLDAKDGVHCDTIRLALVARWLGLRSQSSCEWQETAIGALQKWRLKRVMAYIDDHISEAISLTDLAGAAGLSRMYFAARFRAATGLRPHEYVLRRRVEQAKAMLGQTDESLVEIAFNVGFQTQAHFTTVFKRFTGVTPGRWRFSRQLA